MSDAIFRLVRLSLTVFSVETGRINSLSGTTSLCNIIENMPAFRVNLYIKEDGNLVNLYLSSTADFNSCGGGWTV